MPDICMCHGANCPKALSCYRHTAKPGRYQSYFVDSPNRGKNCDAFLPNIPNPPKERPKPYRVYWTCQECSGEGGDLDDFHTLKEAKQWAKELKEDNKDVEIKKRTKKEMHNED